MRGLIRKSHLACAALAIALLAELIAAGQRTIPVSRSPKTRSRRTDERRTADYQLDPIRLAKEFSLDKKTSRLAFDLYLAVENAIGRGAWDKLDQTKRVAVAREFEKMTGEVLEDWDPEAGGQIRILKSETLDGRATITLLRELELIRLHLSSRGQAWFIVEHEMMDDALPEFADALQGVLKPGTSREQAYDMSGDEALKYVSALISAQGESPELLLLQYKALIARQLEANLESVADAWGPDRQNKAAPKLPVQVSSQAPAQAVEDDRPLRLLQEITRRWPDFAPGHLALAFDLLYFGNGEAVLSTVSKDAESAILSLKRYIDLVPYDPRPWRDLAHACQLLERNSEAEEAYRAAIERDPEYLDHHARLVAFYLGLEQSENAKAAFARMLKIAPSVDDAFDALYEEEGFDPDYAKSLESLLAANQKELESSKSGLVLFAYSQEAQNKSAEAIRAMQRAVAIGAEADDYEYLSQLYREERRFMEALNAANQAIKIDEKFAAGYFERACSLAQLGRKREALAALKKMMELDKESVFDLDDPDLQTLMIMPEFKAIKEKIGGAGRDLNRKK